MFSPASRNSTISVVRFSAPILVRPATYWPSHLTLKRKLRYGSKRLVLGLTRAIGGALPRDQLAGWLTFWLNFRTTNSAGFSGANPTRMFTTPLSISVWVVVLP